MRFSDRHLHLALRLHARAVLVLVEPAWEVEVFEGFRKRNRARTAQLGNPSESLHTGPGLY